MVQIKLLTRSQRKLLRSMYPGLTPRYISAALKFEVNSAIAKRVRYAALHTCNGIIV